MLVQWCIWVEQQWQRNDQMSGLKSFCLWSICEYAAAAARFCHCSTIAGRPALPCAATESSPNHEKSKRRAAACSGVQRRDFGRLTTHMSMWLIRHLLDWNCVHEALCLLCTCMHAIAIYAKLTPLAQSTLSATGWSIMPPIKPLYQRRLCCPISIGVPSSRLLVSMLEL